MKVIYKYQIPIKESFTISMPKNTRIIRIDDVDVNVKLVVHDCPDCLAICYSYR
jgi:hypothetical protein